MSNIDPHSAASTLADISRIEQRVRDEKSYIEAASSYFLWGGLTFFGYLFEYAFPQDAAVAWYVIMAVGMAGMVALGLIGRCKTRIAGGRRVRDLRPLQIQLLALAFGFLWFFMLNGENGDGRSCSAYFPTLFMFTLTVLGLWYGKFILYVGVAATVLVTLFYVFSGPWFDLLMAFGFSGLMLAVGWWFHRMGKRE